MNIKFNKESKDIGLFMGSFNPFHIGHIEAIQKASEFVCQVRIIPAQSNPWKTEEPVELQRRIDMIRLQIKGIGGVSVSKIETEPDEDGKYYSVDQLKAFLESHTNLGGRFVIIGGTDVMETIKNWKDSDWILENFGVLGIARPGYTEGAGGTEVSSSQIRQLIKEGNWEKVEEYVGKDTVNYIKEYGLYQD
jgi:nicotinate (nicotinamide) nucleotide adenylyltransferase